MVDIANLPLTENSIGPKNWFGENSGKGWSDYFGAVKSGFGGIAGAIGNMSTGGILGGIGSAISGIGNMVGNFLNYDQQKKQFEYQKKLQQQIFEREDNAVQRHVADLRAAGLNPALAAGGQGAGAGQAIQVDAPQLGRFGNDFIQAQEIEKENIAMKNMSLQNALMRKQIDQVRLQNEQIGLRNVAYALDNDIYGAYKRDRYYYDTLNAKYKSRYSYKQEHTYYPKEAREWISTAGGLIKAIKPSR